MPTRTCRPVTMPWWRLRRCFRAIPRWEISAAAGRTHFFVVRNSDNSKAMSSGAIVGGLTGALVMAVATSNNPNQGPVDIYPLDEPSARIALAELLQTE